MQINKPTLKAWPIFSRKTAMYIVLLGSKVPSTLPKLNAAAKLNARTSSALIILNDTRRDRGENNLGSQTVVF